MMPIQRLAKLDPAPRRRKAALLLESIERHLLSGRQPTGLPGSSSAGALAAYVAGLATLVREGTESVELKNSSEKAQSAAERAGAAARAFSADGTPAPRDEALIRAIDALRHALLAVEDRACADWDLIDPSTGRPDSEARVVVPGLRVYLEDIRSPFNVGTIFRTAEAFGAEELVLSPATADPLHPRALRSAMGTVELLRWRRAGLGALEELGPAFALELGGRELDEFTFPRQGIVVIGSEELGVSPEALAGCPLGRVSIPMSGAKASLNVAVAFGILVRQWQSSVMKLRDPH